MKTLTQEAEEINQKKDKDRRINIIAMALNAIKRHEEAIKKVKKDIEGIENGRDITPWDDVYYSSES